MRTAEHVFAVIGVITVVAAIAFAVLTVKQNRGWNPFK